VDEAAQAQRVVAAMLERAICLECLAADVDMTDSDVARVLERIANKVRFSAQASGYCEVCEQTTGPVYWMPPRADDPYPPRTPLF
jgi:hypothetical protein